MPKADTTLKSRYRSLVAAIGLFLLLDLGVMVLNLYIASEIGRDAVAINLAGRQRMLTQRLAKSLYEMQAAIAQHRGVAPVLKEAKDSAQLFGLTLDAFTRGGVVPGGTGKLTRIERIKDPEGRILLSRATDIWGPAQVMVQALSLQPDDELSGLDDALGYVSRINNRLLVIMNQLTTRMQEIAAGKAQRLRFVQLTAMVLAFGNFLFILTHFIRQLMQRDETIEVYERGLENLLAAKDEELRRIENRYKASARGTLEVPAAERSRRRRAIHDALRGFRVRGRHISVDQILDLLWLWEDDYADVSEIALFDFVRAACQRLKLYDLRRRLHLELVRTLSLAPEVLGPDPLKDMQAYRGGARSVDEQRDESEHSLGRLLQQIFTRLEVLDRGKALDVRIELATRLHEFPFGPDVAREIREFCVHQGKRHISGHVDPKGVEAVLRIVGEASGRCFGPRVLKNILRQSVGKLREPLRSGVIVQMVQSTTM